MMRWRVVCGLSETMASFSPMMRFSSDDLPAFGRPISETRPDFIVGARACLPRSFARVADFFLFVVVLRQHAGDAHFAYTAPFRIDDFDVKAIDIERLANGWDMAEMAQKETADCLEPLPLDGHVEAIANFVDVGRTAEHERA